MFPKKYLFLSSETTSKDNMINLITLTPKSYVDPTYQRAHPDSTRMA
jgi:hypothetical protein